MAQNVHFCVWTYYLQYIAIVPCGKLGFGFFKPKNKKKRYRRDTSSNCIDVEVYILTRPDKSMQKLEEKIGLHIHNHNDLLAFAAGGKWQLQNVLYLFSYLNVSLLSLMVRKNKWSADRAASRTLHLLGGQDNPKGPTWYAIGQADGP